MENLTGRQLGPYQVISALGEGGMAAVYKAYQPAMERYVAVKVLPRHLAGDPQFTNRFHQEAKLLAQLQHPHILPVFDFGESDGYTYLVMPFVTAGTLANRLTGHPLALPWIYPISSQVGDALDYAHARGMIHRDVKPSNVLMDEGGNCLLSDFGLAKMVEGSIKLTVSGAIVGTPAYMSPEQGLGLPLDRRSDIYSLGVILYETAVGRVPYDAETPIAVVLKHVNDPLPLPRAVNPGVPEALERVILKAMAKKPEDRYATAGEMVRALRAALPDSSRQTGQTEQVKPGIAETQTRTGSALERRPVPGSSAFPRWAYLAGGLGLMVCVGLLAVVLGMALTSRAPSVASATASPRPSMSPTPVASLMPTVVVPVLVSDSFRRADADRCALGPSDLSMGGGASHYYLPIFAGGANIVSNALQNNGLDYGGVQFTAAPGACSNTSIRGENIGQDINIRMDVLVPSDAEGHITQAGPYFRSRAAASGDGIIGGESAGFWVQLHSTGQVKVKQLNPQVYIALTSLPASFDNTRFHSLEVAV